MRLEDQIIEIIKRLQEEVRLNDQRIRQLFQLIGSGPGVGGDMLKSTYDANNNGIVDNSEKLAGHLPEEFAPSAHQHSESDLILSDVLVGNVSTQTHGFCPKLPNNPEQFLNGAGEWIVPPVNYHFGTALTHKNKYYFIHPRIFAITTSSTLFIVRYIYFIPFVISRRIQIAALKAFVNCSQGSEVELGIYSSQLINFGTYELMGPYQLLCYRHYIVNSNSYPDFTLTSPIWLDSGLYFFAFIFLTSAGTLSARMHQYPGITSFAQSGSEQAVVPYYISSTTHDNLPGSIGAANLTVPGSSQATGPLAAIKISDF